MWLKEIRRLTEEQETLRALSYDEHWELLRHCISSVSSAS